MERVHFGFVMALAAVLALGSAALADTTRPSSGLEIHVYPDGTSYMVNPTDSVICFAGYDITDHAGTTMDTSGWTTLASQITAGTITNEITLLVESWYPGDDANFEPVTNSSTSVVELYPYGVAQFAANSSVCIGDIFSSLPDPDDIEALFAIYDDGDWFVGSEGVEVTGQSLQSSAMLVMVPEPASLAMLAVGAVAAIRRRRSA